MEYTGHVLPHFPDTFYEMGIYRIGSYDGRLVDCRYVRHDFPMHASQPDVGSLSPWHVYKPIRLLPQHKRRSQHHHGRHDSLLAGARDLQPADFEEIQDRHRRQLPSRWDRHCGQHQEIGGYD